MKLFTHRLIVAITLVVALPTLADDGDILERAVLETERTETATLEKVIYESDGLRILGYLVYPDSAVEGEDKLPCVIFNRGGNRDFGALTPERAARMGSFIAEAGYVFFASNYRGSTGSEGADEFGGADVNDILNGIKVLDNIAFADTERIGMWGHSRGGMMTYLALKQTDRISAAVVGAGLADAGRMIELRPELEERVLSECVPNWSTEREAAIEARSAVRWADQLPAETPILLLHGTADWRVDPRDSLDMAELLLEARRPYRLMMLEGADHGLSEFWQEVDEAILKWFDRYVRDEGELPNLELHGR